MKIIVFDFDKTLTKNDTLFGFFKFCSKNRPFRNLKISIYCILMIMTKIKLTSNKLLKKLGIYLFLKGINRVEYLNLCKDYSKNIETNALYSEFNFSKNEKIYILSASFKHYIAPLFPKKVTVIGSDLKFKNDIIQDLLYNCFGVVKYNIFIEKFSPYIDILYTDSKSDKYLAKIASSIKIINGDNIYTCNSFKEFKQYFKI